MEIYFGIGPGHFRRGDFGYRLIRWERCTRLRLAAKRGVRVREFAIRTVPEHAAAVIELDAVDDMIRRDQVHAARNAQVTADLHRIDAQVVAVFHVTVADQLAPRFPATAVGTARERAHRA